MKILRFPKISKELLEIVELEQEDIKTVFGVKPNSDNFDNDVRALMMRCHARTDRLLEILEIIKKPTVSNIGASGSEAVAILTMHSYLQDMKYVLELFENTYLVNPKDIHYQSIPALKDRITVLESRKQLYGTQWMNDKHSNPFLIEIIDSKNVTKRRQKYGLGQIKNPKNLGKGAKLYPIGPGVADLNMMKPMNEEEYREYSRYYLSKVI